MPYVSHKMTFGGKTVVLADPKTFPEAPEANSYACPVGVYAGRGSVLMLKTDLEAIADNESHTLTIDYYEYSFQQTSPTVDDTPTIPDSSLFVIDDAGDSVVTDTGAFVIEHDWSIYTGTSTEVTSEVNSYSWGPFYILNNRRLGFGSGGEDAVYLVEFADRRILAERFADCETQQFNLHSYTQDPDTQKYLWNTSANPTTPHEWETVIHRLWPSILGGAPVLPYLPVSTPDDLQWYGCNPWTEALPAIMDRLGFEIVYDPLNDAFSIVLRGEVQTDTPTLPTPLYTADTIDAMKVDAPDRLAIYHHEWGVNYGTERDTGTGSLNDQWLLDPPFERAEQTYLDAKGDVEELELNPVVDTVKPVWVDTKKEYDISDSEIETEKKLAAQEEVRDGFYRDANITRQHRVYSGIHEIKPGSQIKAVAWYDRGQGIRTEYSQHPGPPARKSKGRDLVLCGSDDNFSTLDTITTGFPTYPRTDQLVKIVISAPAGAPGDDEDPLPEYVFEAKVCRVIGGAVVTYENCYLRLMDTDGTGNVQAKDGDFFMARLMGAFAISSDVRPFYVARKGAASSAPDNKMMLIRILESGKTEGDLLAPVSDCCYAGVVLSLDPVPDFCVDPYVEGATIWVAKISATDNPVFHGDEYLGYRVLNSFTPTGQAAFPLYLVKPVPDGIPTYLAEVNTAGDFDGDALTFDAKITAIVSKGSAVVNDVVTVDNDFHVAAVATKKCILIEPTPGNYLAIEMERTKKKLHYDTDPGVDYNGGNLRFDTVFSWGHHADPSPGDQYDLYTLDTSKVLVSNDDNTFTETTIYYIEKGATDDTYGKNVNLITAIDWGADPGDNIVVSHTDAWILQETPAADIPIATADCPTAVVVGGDNYFAFGALGFGEFDGTVDYVDCTSIDSATGDWTLTAWVRPDSSTPSIQYPIGTTSTTGLYVEDTADSDSWGFYDGTTKLSASTNLAQDGTWYHLVVTKTGTTYELWQDGVSKGSTTLADVDVSAMTIGARTSNRIIPVKRNARPSLKSGIARNASESNLPSLWNGLTGIWVPSLGVTGNKLHDLSGRPRDATDGDFNGTTNPPWVHGVQGSVVDFDGVDQYISLSQSKLAGLTQWTIVLRLKFNVSVAGSNDSPGFDDLGVSCFPTIRLGSGGAQCYAHDGSGWILNAVTIPSPVAGQWYHWAIRYDGTTARSWFVDGVESSTSGSVTASKTLTSGNNCNLGGLTSGGSVLPFDGQIAECRFYSRALNDREIASDAGKPLAMFQPKALPLLVSASDKFTGGIGDVRIYGEKLSDANIKQARRAGVPYKSALHEYDFGTGSGYTLIDSGTGLDNGTITTSSPAAFWQSQWDTTVSTAMVCNWVPSGVEGSILYFDALDADANYQADFTCSDLTNGSFGLVGRLDPFTGTHVLLEVTEDGTDAELSLWTYDGTSYTQVGTSAPFTYDDATEYTLLIRFDGPSVYGYVDGALVIDETVAFNTTKTHGGVRCESTDTVVSTLQVVP